MSTTTDVGPATIRLTEAEPDPHVTHASTRRWLKSPGLPDDSDLFTFAGLRREGPRTVADSTGAPARRAADLRDQLVLGGPADLHGNETDSLLLDGATGEVSTTSFFHAGPRPMGRAPLAPSLPTLVRFATAADELTRRRGQFASFADRSERRRSRMPRGNCWRCSRRTWVPRCPCSGRSRP